MGKLKVNSGTRRFPSANVYLLQAVLCQHAKKAQKCICLKRAQNHINPPLFKLAIFTASGTRLRSHNCLHQCDATADLGLL